MFTQFFPLLVAAVATRIGANHLVRRRLSMRIDIPQGLAATIILQSIVTEIFWSLPLPSGLIIGLPCWPSDHQVVAGVFENVWMSLPESDTAEKSSCNPNANKHRL